MGNPPVPIVMHPTADLDRRRFTVGVGRAWADLLTPINFYRMNVTGFGLDVVVQTPIEVVPGTVIYPQIAAACQFSGHRPRNRDGVYAGPPSLIAEAYSEHEDWGKVMGQTQALLARGGVPEYIAQAGGQLRWFGLEDGAYARVEPDAEGYIRSTALPGLWINVEAYRNKEHGRLFGGIVEGIESELEERCRAVYRP